MRTKSVLLATTAASVLLVTPASANHFNGWYIGVEGGASWVEDLDHTFVSTAFAPTTFTFLNTTSFDAGWAAFATVGYGFGGGLRAEFEAGYRQNDGDGILTYVTSILRTPLATTAPYTVELSQFTAMVNVLYDFRMSKSVSLSLGAGAGGDFLDHDVNFLTFSSIDDSDWKFAWQGIAGLNVALGEQTALFVNYRYLQVQDVDDADFRPVFAAVMRTDDNISKHAVTAGLRFDLSPDHVAPPPPPPTPPPPPPAEPPPPKEFLVFFGYNKANLTPEAIAVIKEAAAAYKATGAANLRVVGHADRSGSDSYNQGLSLRRANAVKGGLAGEGVPDSAIAVEGRGESDPLVPTADGVREPQNRRVNITM